MISIILVANSNSSISAGSSLMLHFNIHMRQYDSESLYLCMPIRN